MGFILKMGINEENPDNEYRFSADNNGGGGGGGGADLPPGGTTGQVLTKQSDGSNDWQDPPLLNSKFFSTASKGTIITLTLNKVNDQLFTITKHSIVNVQVKKGVCYCVDAQAGIFDKGHKIFHYSGIIVFDNSKIGYLSLTGVNADLPSRIFKIDYTFINNESSGVMSVTDFPNFNDKTITLDFNYAKIKAIFNYE